MTKHPSLLRAALAATLFAAGCTTTVPYDPFKMPKDEFYGKIKTIAVAPIRVPNDIVDPEAVKTSLESLVEAKVREAGFSPVPPKDTGGVFDEMNKQMGGVFDPITGQRDETKVKAAEEHARRELATRFKADAVLHARFLPGTTPFGGGKANWHGTSESVATAEGFLAAFQVSNLRGNIGTLSLLVVIEDIQGVNVYINMGGIQLLAKVSGGQFVQVPRDQLLANKERNAAAVNIALSPLVKNPAQTESPKTQP
jgi:hypothetical protein